MIFLCNAKLKRTTLIREGFKYTIAVRYMESQEQAPLRNNSVQPSSPIQVDPQPASPILSDSTTPAIENAIPYNPAPGNFNVITSWLAELYNQYASPQERAAYLAGCEKIKDESNQTYEAALRSPEIIVPNEGLPLTKEATNLSEIVAVSVASLQAAAHKANITVENCKVLGQECEGVIKGYDKIITSAQSWRTFFKVTGFITALVLIAVKIGLAGKLPDIAMGIGSAVVNNMSSSESVQLLKEGVTAPVPSGSEITELIIQHPLTFIGGVGFTLGATAAIKFGLLVLRAARR